MSTNVGGFADGDFPSTVSAVKINYASVGMATPFNLWSILSNGELLTTNRNPNIFEFFIINIETASVSFHKKRTDITAVTICGSCVINRFTGSTEFLIGGKD